MLMYDALGVLNNKLEFGHNQLFNYLIWTSDLEGAVLKTKKKVDDKPIKDREVEGRWVMFGLKEKEDMHKPFNFRLGERPPIEFRLAFLKTAMEVIDYQANWEQEGFTTFGVVTVKERENHG